MEYLSHDNWAAASAEIKDIINSKLGASSLISRQQLLCFPLSWKSSWTAEIMSQGVSWLVFYLFFKILLCTPGKYQTNKYESDLLILRAEFETPVKNWGWGSDSETLTRHGGSHGCCHVVLWKLWRPTISKNFFLLLFLTARKLVSLLLFEPSIF